MRFYARPSPRLLRQILADAFLFGWAILWWFLSSALATTIAGFAAPARELAQTSRMLRQHVDAAAKQVEQIPYIGGGIRQPFDAITGELSDLTVSTAAQVRSAEAMATATGWVTFLLPVLFALTVWFAYRLRYVRATGRLRRAVALPGGPELIAWRALATLPLSNLTLIPHALSRLRNNDPAVVEELVNAAFRHLGMSRL